MSIKSIDGHFHQFRHDRELFMQLGLEVAVKVAELMKDKDKGIFLHPDDVHYIVQDVPFQFDSPGTSIDHDVVINGAIVFEQGHIAKLFTEELGWEMTIEEEMALLFYLFYSPSPTMVSTDGDQVLRPINCITVRSVIEQALGVRPYLLNDILLKYFEIDGEETPCYYLPAPLICTNQKYIHSGEPGTIVPFGRIQFERALGSITGNALTTLILGGHIERGDFDITGQDPSKITLAYPEHGISPIGIAIPVAKYFELTGSSLDFPQIASLSSRERLQLDELLAAREVDQPDASNNYMLQETVPLAIPEGYVWKLDTGLVVRGPGGFFLPYQGSYHRHLESTILDGGWGTGPEGKKPIRLEIRNMRNFGAPDDQSGEVNRYVIARIFRPMTWEA